MNTFKLRDEIIENGFKTIIRSFGKVSNQLTAQQAYATPSATFLNRPS